MYKYVINIKGMMCKTCEKHVTKAIENAVKGVKVFASAQTGICEVESAKNGLESELESAILNAGFEVLSVKKEETLKKGLFAKIFK
ncbi:MAG: heavy-metal-associated domain-containing protein [Clostridia bacterium]|nr:heavy-metal-associated domain-containing protein [Clostridia bacterium]